ncbi:O-methyltransferase-domain-containing protein [Schizophyllum amplum]|uniref:O-methyltransferase-domain-containing protein n=1 Tax=Schizophyllum amplum TaxID=97359 RepID=A0A550CGH1_9AGAR|nr:O-methyltransferase-domain-containing protein [Auriculariopsis ampla]
MVSPSPAGYDAWDASDQYHARFLLGPDAALDFALSNSKKHGLPDIAVSASQGKLLHLLVRSLGAKRIAEVGTLGGYSTIWFARAVGPEGKVVTFELQDKHAKVARENLEHAGVGDRVEIVVGPAANSLAATEGNGTFDFAFVDADKESNVTYVKECKRLVKSGGVIIVDNVVRNGAVADENNDHPSNVGVRALLKYLQDDQELEGTTVPTAGSKGFDGWMYLLRK